MMFRDSVNNIHFYNTFRCINRAKQHSPPLTYMRETEKRNTKWLLSCQTCLCVSLQHFQQHDNITACLSLRFEHTQNLDELNS